MESVHLRNFSYSGTPVGQYKYDTSGNIVHNYTTFYGMPINPMKYRSLRSRPLELQRVSCRSPNELPKSSLDLTKRSKLASNINQREIFVLQNGACVAQGNKLPGFYYKFDLIQKFERTSHVEEMKMFFLECQRFFKPATEIKFLFSTSGKLLHCLHELKSDAKIALVGPTCVFSSIRQVESSEVNRANTRSPLYKSFYEENESVMENLNSHFRVTSSRSRGANLGTNRVKVLKPVKIRPERLKPDELKLKLGRVSYNIDKTFPTLCSQGVQQLKERFKFSEQELHNLYGKFKLMVLLSSGINSNHDIATGIARETFVSYYSKSSELGRILGKIFDKFDIDGGGTVSWEEYLEAMSIIWHGSTEEQLDFFFSVYDSDGNGSLSFKEIQGLCKLQLQMESADQLIEELSYSFASLIFDLTETSYNDEIPAWKIKEVINKQQDRSLIEMFCSFNCLK